MKGELFPVVLLKITGWKIKYVSMLQQWISEFLQLYKHATMLFAYLFISSIGLLLQKL